MIKKIRPNLIIIVFALLAVVAHWSWMADKAMDEFGALPVDTTANVLRLEALKTMNKIIAGGGPTLAVITVLGGIAMMLVRDKGQRPPSVTETAHIEVVRMLSDHLREDAALSDTISDVESITEGLKRHAPESQNPIE